MTFEEQIAALKERHEALTMNLELLAHQSEEHSKQLALDGEHIRALARIAEIHERRLTHLEGDAS
jgi:hypothetical protein